MHTAVVADLFQATVWVFLGLTLYLLLKHAHKTAAIAIVVFVAIGAGITLLNAVFEFEGLRVATGAVHVAASGTAGSNATVLLLLDTQHYGYLIAQIFFGLWLVPLGYLAYKSGWFPKALGVLLVVGASATSWARSRRSWPPAPARRSTPSSPSRQQSRRSRWSYTCS